MNSEEIRKEILKKLYDRFFKNYLFGLTDRNIQELDYDNNEIAKTLKELESDCLIKRSHGYYILTPHGLECFERIAIPTEVNKNITERQIILNELKKIYNLDVNTTIDQEQVKQWINSQDKFHILAQVYYLTEKKYVESRFNLGGSFTIKLTADGNKSFENVDYGIAEHNENGYNTLYRLENHLRRFIQKKLEEKYGASWWTKIHQILRAKADDKKQTEQSDVWQISTTLSDLEYLEFPDLGRIIVKEWDIFKLVFIDQDKVRVKLDELQKIRNAIAHTRTLSEDSFMRLDMYSKEIFKMTD